MWLWIGLGLIFIDCIAVKLFDDIIRPYTYRKAIVNATMISGLIMVIVGFSMMIIK